MYSVGQTLHVHLQDSSTFLREMTSRLPSWKCDVISAIRLRQSMHIYLTNKPAKFHPELIWSDGALVFFEDDQTPQQEEQQ